MLKYKINKDFIKSYIKKIEGSEVESGHTIAHESDNYIIYNTKYEENIFNKNLTFTRVDGSNISYKENKEIKSNKGKTLIVNNFPQKPLLATSFEEIKTPLKDNDESNETTFLKFEFYNNPLFFNKNRDYIIGEYINKRGTNQVITFFKGEDINSKINKINTCGDYVIYNNIFIYFCSHDGDNLKREENENLNNETVFVYYPEELNETFQQYQENGHLTLHCLVPMTNTGIDSKSELLWQISGNNKELSEAIKENFKSLVFYAEDTRFFEREKISDTEVKLKFKDGTYVSFNYDSIGIMLPQVENIGNNLYLEEKYDNIIEEEVDKNINSIVDYEKMLFNPVYKDDNEKFHNVNEINFNLHFRDREFIDDYDEEGKYIGYGEWKTSDEKYWFNYPYVNGNVLVPKFDGLTVDMADIIGQLDYSDDDIYYQKNKVGQSFIRLSFYDNMDRRTQKLLFYSTIFFDLKKLYGKYVKDINISSLKQDEDEYVFYEYLDKENRLESSFYTYNRYTADATSDGFYLYLYPKLVSGAMETEIYMKVEFNHAKFGYTIPLTMPVDDELQPIDPTSGNFPLDYLSYFEDVTETVSGTTAITEYWRVDTNKLNNDLYIRVRIKYDIENKRYIYYIPNNRSEKLVFNLFEPRINGFIEKE